MRVLIAIDAPRVKEAGAAGVAFHHATELEKLGHRVQLWFHDDVLPKPRWPLKLQALEFAATLARRIRENSRQFDVVDIHAPSGCLYGMYHKLFPSAQLPPYVFTMHGCEERYVVAMRAEDRKGRSDYFRWKNRAWHWLYHQRMFDYSISTADYGAVVNREGWLISELKHRHAFGRIWYVPNGVDEEFFLTRDFGLPPANRLLFVGSWLDRKGVYYLVDSFTELARRMEHLTLTVAGCQRSPDDVKAFFPPEIRNRVLVRPQLSRSEMPQIYASHDIFVLPSLMEGMPLVLLEAMATAMPVVTTNSSGMADLVEHDYNGLLVPAADAQAFARAVDRLTTDANLRHYLGLNAQETVRRYTWPKVTSRLEHILKLAAESRPKTAD